MNKPDALRKAIEASNPDLARDPERLLMFIDRGNVRSFMTADFSFEYRYALNIIISDFTGDTALLMIPILSWLRINQPDLLTPPKEALSFEVDILDNGAVDLEINLQLTEQMAVTKRDDGGFDMLYLPEPENLFDDELGAGGVDPVPDLSAIYLSTGEKLLPDEPPLGADVQP